MSRNGTLLPVPEGGNLWHTIEALRRSYVEEPWRWLYRSWWLKRVENELRAVYPEASSADLRLTARHASSEPGPIFPLRDGPNVP